MPAVAVLAQVLRGHLRPAPVHGEGEPAPFLGAQMHDVRAQQHGRHRGRPQEVEAADRRDDRAKGEGEEEDRGGAPTARQHLRALCAPGALRIDPTGARAPRGYGHRRVRRSLLGLPLLGTLGRLRRGSRPLRCAHRVVHTGFRMRRGRGEGPDVHGIHSVRVHVRLGVGRRLLGGALPQFLGVPALHRRPSGQQPDGGAEAFRRAGFIELVLPAEPHRHQVGGPGPDDDCIDEAAAAHVSHRRGVCTGASANWPGVSHDLADSKDFFVIVRINSRRLRVR